MTTLDNIRSVLGETLGLGDRAAALTADSKLLGNLPELDSLAVVEVVGGLER